MSALETLPATDTGLLRFITCGNVDDGKSTLIGRLLHDTRTILSDTLVAMEKSSHRKGLQEIDLSLLTDGLQSEREQGITIDVAYRYFSSGRRKYIIADTPGHEQYTRNMVTGASTADLAIILIDARNGVRTQTRRHATISKLIGIRHLIVAINKIDLVDFNEARFHEICADFNAFFKPGPEYVIEFIPMSALLGDMVVERGNHLPWYSGPSLFEALEATNTCHDRCAAFRFPVQYICRPQQAADQHLHDYRGLMGQVESGEISVGDEVVILPSGTKARVKSIDLGETSLTTAIEGQSISLQLDVDVDVSRGDMLARVNEQPVVTKEITADLCWLSETPLSPTRKYLVRHTTRETKAKLIGIDFKLNINTLQHEQVETLAMNDIGQVRFKLAQALCCDDYQHIKSGGAFVVIDESTNNTVGAGMIKLAS